MSIGFALSHFARISGIGENMVSGIRFALMEGGRNPSEFQKAIDIPQMPAVLTEQCVRYIVSNPGILQQLNDCLMVEKGENLEFVYCPAMGFKVAPSF
jgi:hypothetical protein